MKHFLTQLFRVLLPLLFCSGIVPFSFAQQKNVNRSPKIVEDENESHAKRAEYELMRLRDPATGQIPPNIRNKELKFARTLPSKEQTMSYKQAGSEEIQNVNWISRGPWNVGGRTYAIGVDIKNDSIILAGSTTGGIHRSTDKGNSWVRTTPLDDLPSVRSLVQDTRLGKTNTWYYGTGEIGSNTGAYPLWLNYGTGWGEYYGNGIYKSTDDGKTWAKLESTATPDSASFNQPFNFVNKLVIDPSDTLHDILYAAVAGGIERSSDGGKTWTMVLGNFPNGPTYTDVDVTSTGIVYAGLSSLSLNFGYNSSWNGVYRSRDGIHWTNITPDSWTQNSYLISLGIAPSNKNIIYVGGINITSNSESSYFWKYTAGTTDTTGVWEDRSDNFNQTVGNSAGAIGTDDLLYLAIKPDDENTVFTGGYEVWRSTDAFATTNNVSNICLYNGSPYVHVDQETIKFSHSNPSFAVIGCDGGMYSTDDVMAQDNVSWTSLDNNYLTAQFYTVAIDHSNVNDIIVGGMQDNSTAFTNTTDETEPWTFLFGGDGSYCAISRDRGSYYVSYQDANIFREIVDDNGNILDQGCVDPIGGAHPIGSLGYLFINPFVLDPNNNDQMYLPAGYYLWRNSDLTMIPLGSYDSSTVNWTRLTKTRLPSNSPFGQYSQMSAIAVSTIPANRVYYGTNDGQLYRLDSANINNSIPKNIWKGKGFPANSFINCIAVDDRNADHAIVVFANYNVQSLFFTTDGGFSWTPIGGNLEEHPDGTGNGPSCRWVSILHSGNGIEYLVGTSTGLYSTTELNGMSTVWSLEGASTIGNNIVNMMDTRELDGIVAVATCGNGVFTGQFAPASSVSENKAGSNSEVQLFPNPTMGIINIHKTTNDLLNVSVINILGEKIVRMTAPNSSDFTIDLVNQPPGIYFVHFQANGLDEIRKIIKE